MASRRGRLGVGLAIGVVVGVALATVVTIVLLEVLRRNPPVGVDTTADTPTLHVMASPASATLDAPATVDRGNQHQT